MLNKLLVVICLIAATGFAQCGGCLVSTRVGVKAGLILCNYDPGDGTAAYSGTGSLFGFGMGTDFLKLISVDVTPQYTTTNYTRQEPLFERTLAYKNLYFPVFVSLKAGMIPLVSPYIGLGLGFCMTASAYDVQKYANGTIIETQLGGGISPAYLIVGGGVELKLIKFRISPEFTAHIQPTDPEDPNPPPAQAINYCLSLGFYYTP
jgi:hypothetical protein